LSGKGYLRPVSLVVIDRMNLDAGVRTALATEAELKPS
jgi:hypothetical protein